MKNILLVVAIISTSTVKCQDSNILGEYDFHNIKINNVTLKSIQETSGLATNMQTLFGLPVTKKTDPDGEFSNYYYDGFSIAFSSVISSNSQLELARFEISNNMASLNVKGILITIGDEILKLGKTIKNQNTDGSTSVIYQACWGCNSYIAIDYNESTGIITRIIYIEMT